MVAAIRVMQRRDEGGEATNPLAVRFDLNEDERKTYDVAKKRLIETLMPRCSIDSSRVAESQAGVRPVTGLPGRIN